MPEIRGGDGLKQSQDKFMLATNPASVKYILHLHISHVGGEVQKNILLVLLWAPANVGEKHCLVCAQRLVASQEFGFNKR